MSANIALGGTTFCMIKKIEAVIKKVVGEKVKFSVMASEKSEFGHYSTNAAFLVKEDPKILADKIVKSGGKLFEKFEVAGKFINLWISKETLIKELADILKFKGFKGLNIKSEKINLEFILN